MKKSLQADIALFIVTIFWGAGFPVTKFALETISPLYHIGFRFIIAAVLLSLIFYKKMLKVEKSIIKPAAYMAVLLFATYAFQTIGLQYTTASKSSFFSGLAVIFVPMLSFIFFRAKVNANTIISVSLAFMGLFFLSYAGNDFSFNIGDFLTIMCSATYAMLLLLTSNYVKVHDATQLSIVQMYFVALMGLISAALFENWPSNVSLLSFNSLLFSAVFATAFAFWVQAAAQKFASASHVALIFTMEPVFGALLSWLVLGEQLGFKGLLGGALILSAMIMAEMDLTGLERKFKAIGQKNKQA
ncbi:MAG: RhaT [Clostridia bacterium]|nr:RhaT [Clostridia bacterium]